MNRADTIAVMTLTAAVVFLSAAIAAAVAPHWDELTDRGAARLIEQRNQNPPLLQH